MGETEEGVKSSLGLKYSKLRDHPLHTAHLWMEMKREQDGAEDLWRIHDGLYDLSDFIEEHPGGSEWLELTKGTDITEAFESHHINTTPETLLKKFYRKDAKIPRNSPFTFKDGDFYKTLKERIRAALPQVPEKAESRTKFMTDLLLVGYLSSALLAVYFWSFFLGALSGILLGLTTIAAHNFFHQKNNLRMYYFNFSLMHYREWRVSHALSHHLYTNTIYDLEISSLEPFLQYLPTKKHFIFRYISWAYSPVVYIFLFVGHFLKTLLQDILNRKRFSLVCFLPFVVPVLMNIVSRNFFATITMFLFIETIGSLHFGVVGVNAAHHHPDIFHDGDLPRPKDEMDWGIFQMDAVMDRKDITGSLFLVLTNFGDHALHHLFPTIDHGKLEYLYPVFLKTCEEFGIKWRLSSQLELTKGQYLQLARTEPNTTPRNSVKKCDQ